MVEFVGNNMMNVILLTIAMELTHIVDLTLINEMGNIVIQRNPSVITGTVGYLINSVET